MGITKSGHFTEQQNNLAAIAKALGHPARIAILDYLLKVDVCICGDIVGEIPLAQPTISQHLKELKQVGLIKGSISGNTVCYCLDEVAVSTLQSYLSVLSQKLRDHQNQCC
ncbi:MAG: winged helix-turn-helix transcriptional regulator [Bacteroidetes bacterium]|nr:winged helix-turn-helix transcriptional regulator [Bacteroidota bacterium]